MTAQTGRTVARFTNFLVDDAAGTLRSIAVDSINGVGLTYDEVNLTAFQDAIKNALLGHPGCTISITGPFDTTASTGSHTVLSAIVGLLVPLSLDVQVGMRHVWESGEPQFGITSSATSGFLCAEYIPDVNNGKYSAKFVVMGPTAPAWGTAAET
jgi:hypothetical protein